MKTLAEIARSSRTQFDLTDPADRSSLAQLTHQLCENGHWSIQDLQTASRDPQAALEFRLACVLVDSKRWLNTFGEAKRIGVVYAMWGEHNRLLPRSAGNPHGEDSLRVKLDQLQWAFEGTQVEWTLYAVDDGCPHGSAKIARKMAAEHPAAHRVQVLELDKALPATDGPLARLACADDSRKAGAIILGCMHALDQGADAIVYTDADNSVHLGQIGLLMRGWIDEQAPVVLGDRKHADAVLVKQEARWGVGIVLLRHMQRMIGAEIYSRGILDTQAAFKLYSKEVLKGLLRSPTVYDFSFDSDWILGSLAQGAEPLQVPFAFIDSAAESASIAQGPMTTWETLLHGLTAAVRRHGVPHNEAMARVLDEEVKSSADLDKVINTLPPQLRDATANRIGDPALMSPEEVQAWFRCH